MSNSTNIHFMFLISRERREQQQHAGSLPRPQLRFAVKVGQLVATTEEKSQSRCCITDLLLAIGGRCHLSLLQYAPEQRQSGARSDHHNWRLSFGRQSNRARLDDRPHGGANAQLPQPVRAQAQSLRLQFGAILDDGHEQIEAAGLAARCNRKRSLFDRLEQLENGGQVQAGRGAAEVVQYLQDGATWPRHIVEKVLLALSRRQFGELLALQFVGAVAGEQLEGTLARTRV